MGWDGKEGEERRRGDVGRGGKGGNLWPSLPSAAYASNKRSIICEY